MAVFDPMKFSALLKKAIGSRSAREFSLEAGISRYQVSRRLNGALSSPPRKGTLLAISKTAQNAVTYEQLLVCCGYMDAPDASSLQDAHAQDIKKARACILANMDSLNSPCQIPAECPQIDCDFEILVGNDPCIRWDFVCISSALTPSEAGNTVNQRYLDLMYSRLDTYSKLSFLTSRQDLFDECGRHLPLNLDANVSSILYEPDLLEVMSEVELSASKTTPLPGGACSFIAGS